MLTNALIEHNHKAIKSRRPVTDRHRPLFRSPSQILCNCLCPVSKLQLHRIRNGLHKGLW